MIILLLRTVDGVDTIGSDAEGAFCNHACMVDCTVLLMWKCAVEKRTCDARAQGEGEGGSGGVDCKSFFAWSAFFDEKEHIT